MEPRLVSHRADADGLRAPPRRGLFQWSHGLYVEPQMMTNLKGVSSMFQWSHGPWGRCLHCLHRFQWSHDWSAVETYSKLITNANPTYVSMELRLVSRKAQSFECCSGQPVYVSMEPRLVSRRDLLAASSRIHSDSGRFNGATTVQP